MRSMGTMAVGLLSAALMQASSLGVLASTPAGQNPPPQVSSHAVRAAPHYVGSAVCAQCHTQIYEDYEKTGMGRSISKLTPQLIHAMRIPASIRDRKTHRGFDIYTEGGRLYESESAQNSSGQTLFRVTQPIRWIVGAGEDAYGGIVERGHYLFLAPLGFYTRAQTWAPAPGYDHLDLSFSRPALEGCLFCHSGRIRPVAGTNGEYQTPAFQQLAIGCEDCHGPGSAHVALMRSGIGLRGRNLEIVDPSHLSSTLANNICEKCHEIGDARVLQPGESYRDILPGKPLNDYLAIFVVPPTRSTPPPPDHLQQYYEMTMSKCYRATDGRLRCITCHDPHIELSAAEAPRYYNRRCMICHTVSSCTLPLSKRMNGKVPDDCIRCHMPQRPVGFLAHTALTNHRIIAYPGEPLPSSIYHATTPALPDLVDLDPAPGQRNTAPPLLTLLKAYGTLAVQYPKYQAPYLRVLEQLKDKHANHALVQAALGRRDLKAGEYPKALEHLRLAIRLDPMSAVVYADLSTCWQALGHLDQALQAQQQAVQHDPFNPVLQKRLIVLYIHQKQYGQATSALKQYVKTFPQDLFMRRMLALAERQSG